MLVPPSLMTILVMAYATKLTYAYISAVFIAGVGIFELQKVARQKEWCEYVHVGEKK
jgi:hypothetical protein